MPEKVVITLLDYGLAGIIIISLALVIVTLWRTNKEIISAHMKCDVLRDENTKALHILTENIKANTENNKVFYRETLEAFRDVIKSHYNNNRR